MMMLTANRQQQKALEQVLDPLLGQGEQIARELDPVLLALSGDQPLSQQEVEQVKEQLKDRFREAQAQLDALWATCDKMLSQNA